MIDDSRMGRPAFDELTDEVKRLYELIVPELTCAEDGTNVLVIGARGGREAAGPVI